MIKLLDIIRRQQLLHNLDPEIIIIPGGDGGSSGGGSGGGQGGTTSGTVVPGISITPSTTQEISVGGQICFTATANIVIPERSERPPEFDPIMVNGCTVYNPSNGFYKKNCGVNDSPDAEISDPVPIPRLQPWHIRASNQFFETPGTPLNQSSTFVGVKTGGYFFYWSNDRFCGTTPTGSCTAPRTATARVNFPNLTTQALFIGDLGIREFRVRSDGFTIFWESFSGGFWQLHASMPIPADITEFFFFSNALYINNVWTNMRAYRGTYQGAGTVTWTTTCGTITVTGNQGCFTSDTIGTCQVCVSNPYLEEMPCVNVSISALFLQPSGITCGECT